MKFYGHREKIVKGKQASVSKKEGGCARVLFSLFSNFLKICLIIEAPCISAQYRGVKQANKSAVNSSAEGDSRDLSGEPSSIAWHQEGNLGLTGLG